MLLFLASTYFIFTQPTATVEPFILKQGAPKAVGNMLLKRHAEMLKRGELRKYETPLRE